MMMGGMPVYFDSFLTERKQVSFPRSRAKRIRKKWAKRTENWRETPKKVIYRVGDSFVVHPGYWPEFCKEAGIDKAISAEGRPGAGLYGISMCRSQARIMSTVEDFASDMCRSFAKENFGSLHMPRMLFNTFA